KLLASPTNCAAPLEAKLGTDLLYSTCSPKSHRSRRVPVRCVRFTAFGNWFCISTSTCRSVSTRLKGLPCQSSMAPREIGLPWLRAPRRRGSPGRAGCCQVAGRRDRQYRRFQNAEKLAQAIEEFDAAKLRDIAPGRSYDFYYLFHGIVQH